MKPPYSPSEAAGLPNPEVAETPATRLRALCRRKGLTVSGLAAAAGVSSSTLARINRNDEVHPRVWAKLLGHLDTIPDIPLAAEVLAS